MTIRLEKRPLSDLKPYGRNAKGHNDTDVMLIAASIERFGFNDPIAVDEEGEIIEGHGRFEAAGLLGFDLVPVLVLSGLTDEQKRLYRIAHNKIALSSSFDFPALVNVLRSIMGDDLNMQNLGFSPNAAHDLLNVNFRDESEPQVMKPMKVEIGEIIWDTVEQKKAWEAFMARLTAAHPDMSPGRALVQFAARSGIFEGRRAAEPNTQVEDGDETHVEL